MAASNRHSCREFRSTNNQRLQRFSLALRTAET
jgi:hypothetical protein